jgi:hypothetical protein
VLAKTHACTVRSQIPVDGGIWTLLKREIFQVLGVTSVPSPRLLSERALVEFICDMATLASRYWVVPPQAIERCVVIGIFCPG